MTLTRFLCGALASYRLMHQLIRLAAIAAWTAILFCEIYGRISGTIVR